MTCRPKAIARSMPAVALSPPIHSQPQARAAEPLSGWLLGVRLVGQCDPLGWVLAHEVALARVVVERPQGLRDPAR